MVWQVHMVYSFSANNTTVEVGLSFLFIIEFFIIHTNKIDEQTKPKNPPLL